MSILKKVTGFIVLVILPNVSCWFDVVSYRHPVPKEFYKSNLYTVIEYTIFVETFLWYVPLIVLLYISFKYFVLKKSISTYGYRGYVLMYIIGQILFFVGAWFFPKDY